LPRNLSRKPPQLLGLGLTSQEIFLIEFGYDGYQKNPLSIQIPKMSTYLYEKMHPKQAILKQRWLSLLQGLYYQFFIQFLPVTFCRCTLSIRQLAFFEISIERGFF
jgi:hypothetical protein